VLPAGKPELEIVDFDLRQMVEKVADLLVSGADAKGIELLAFVRADLPRYVCGDPRRLT